MFTLKVDRDGIVLFRHFTSREAMSAAGRTEIRKGFTPLAMFLPGEVVA
ncbi:MAG: hypothetical protein LC650_00705 [Actinobacteria bacterium]|nr:hypothetical protein [Actinomycetota bacterium]